METFFFLHFILKKMAEYYKEQLLKEQRMKYMSCYKNVEYG